MAFEARRKRAMSRERIEMDRLRELVRLHRMGESGREVSRLLRMGPNTERRYRRVLAKAGLLDGPLDALPELEALRSVIEAALPPAQIPAQQTSSLEEWRDELVVLHDKGLQARAAYDRLRVASAGGPRPFLGSYSAVKRFWRQLRKERGVRPEDVAIPVVTAPGEVAQVDFGYAGKLYDPALGGEPRRRCNPGLTPRSWRQRTPRGGTPRRSPAATRVLRRTE